MSSNTSTCGITALILLNYVFEVLLKLTAMVHLSEKIVKVIY
jgi:hypothetical protein